jgi:hypothetical protein
MRETDCFNKTAKLHPASEFTDSIKIIFENSYLFSYIIIFRIYKITVHRTWSNELYY